MKRNFFTSSKKALEEGALRDLLTIYRGNPDAVIKEYGISRRHFYRKVKEYDLAPRGYKPRKKESA